MSFSSCLTLDLNCYNGFITLLLFVFDCFAMKLAIRQKSYTRFQLLPFPPESKTLTIIQLIPELIRSEIEFVVTINIFWPFLRCSIDVFMCVVSDKFRETMRLPMKMEAKHKSEQNQIFNYIFGRT